MFKTVVVVLLVFNRFNTQIWWWSLLWNDCQWPIIIQWLLSSSSSWTEENNHHYCLASTIFIYCYYYFFFRKTKEKKLIISIDSIWKNTKKWNWLIVVVIINFFSSCSLFYILRLYTVQFRCTDLIEGKNRKMNEKKLNKQSMFMSWLGDYPIVQSPSKKTNDFFQLTSTTIDDHVPNLS